LYVDKFNEVQDEIMEVASEERVEKTGRENVHGSGVAQ